MAMTKSTGEGERASFPISLAEECSVVRLHKIESGWHVKKRLLELGFVKDERIKIIKNHHRGPMAVKIKDARFAIGRGEAQKIFVYEESP